MERFMPLAAAVESYGLPPLQQVIFSIPILISVIILIAIGVVLYYAMRKSAVKEREQLRQDALQLARRVLLKRGGTDADWKKIIAAFESGNNLNPTAIFMQKDIFAGTFVPLLTGQFDQKFAQRMFSIFFPPQRDSARIVEGQPQQQGPQRTKETQRVAAGAAASNSATSDSNRFSSRRITSQGVLDLMDGSLRPGSMATLKFRGIDDPMQCVVMGHNSQNIDFALPAGKQRLVPKITPGLRVEGFLEHGPVLLGFTSAVIMAVGGSMPYVRMEAWHTARDIRKRDAVRLHLSLEITFQHIPTSQADAIRMSALDQESGSVIPGRLIDVSLGGCCIETASNNMFKIGDMIRFSKALAPNTEPVTLLGSLVNSKPATDENPFQRLNIQYLLVDETSQIQLVRALKQLHQQSAQQEWMRAQQLLQKMRHNKIQSIGAPATRG